MFHFRVFHFRVFHFRVFHFRKSQSQILIHEPNTCFLFLAVSFAACPTVGSICTICENMRLERKCSRTSSRFAPRQEPSRIRTRRNPAMHASE